ncbi:Gfo/Idh/MocA family protein [Arthrobacter sp. FW306-04-A]|uniref:Gfo/Idh/MocA family protein n=1 Tax=Arthrobacter sp. FW306-04-A TaxID=2879619 RepID=UPI0037C071F0|nr:Gfo/Idh/MocA family oxidoreductase [Arthrobacter sp. FW306-04-A]
MTNANTVGTPGPRLRTAIVGCGVIGRQHAQVVTANGDLELVALIDVVESAATGLADTVENQSHKPGPATFATLAAALRNSDIDLVAICTPSGLHSDLAVEALRAGKHVIIEKPIDVDLPSARRVAEAAAAATGQVTSVISQHRFDPASVAVASAVKSGRFGKITSGVASLAWWRAQNYYDSGQWRGTWELDGGGAVMNQGVHSVDLLLWFMGTPVQIQAHTALLAHERIEVEDTAVATVRFASGALAVIHCTTAAYPGLTARIQVHGERGSAVVDNDRLQYFHAADNAPAGESGSSYGLAGGGNQAELEVGVHDASANTKGADDLQTAHQKQYADVVQAIRTGKEPRVGVSEATAALATVRALYVSATLGTAVHFEDVLAGKYDDVTVQTGGDA